MKFALALLTLIALCPLAGCENIGDNPRATFWWNSRLVPVGNEERISSGTGATREYYLAMPPAEESR